MGNLFVFIVFYFMFVLYSAFTKDERIVERNRRMFPIIDPEDMTMENIIQNRILKNEAYDEVSRRCRKLAQNGEVTYFSAEDIDKIVEDLKKENK